MSGTSDREPGLSASSGKSRLPFRDSSGPPSGRRRSRRSRSRRLPPWVMLLITALVGAGLAAGVLSTEAFFVPHTSHSMEPTLLPDEAFRADVAWSTRRGPRRGEIWVLNNPHPLDQNGPFLVKRVIGLPGDVLEVTSGQVVLNHHVLSEPYCAEPVRKKLSKRKLGPNQYWVMGDNRNASEDSMNFGALPRRAFVGHALFRYWPLNHLGLL